VIQTAFGPDDQWVLTVSQAGQAQLWDPESGLPVSEPFTHDARPVCAQFETGGHALWIAYIDGTVQSHPVPLSDPNESERLSALAEITGRLTFSPPNQFRVTPVGAWDRFASQ
jgi:hypothetical protein